MSEFKIAKRQIRLEVIENFIVYNLQHTKVYSVYSGSVNGLREGNEE